MARYNEILVGRFNRHFQKLLSMKGEPPAPQLSSEIQPALQLFSGVEERYLQAWDRFGRVVFNNVAGQTSAWRLRNPIGSNIIAVVEKVTVRNAGSTTMNIFIGTSNTDENVSNNPSGAFDPRGRSSSGLILSFNNAAPASTVGFTTVWSHGATGTTQFDIVLTDDMEIPLLPGNLLCITNGAVATQLEVACWWRERFLEESERF